RVTEAHPMPDRDFPIIDVHAHFPVVDSLRYPGVRLELHPLLDGYAKDRMQRMHREWSTEPAEPVAKTPEEIEAIADRWLAELDKHGVQTGNFVSGQTNDLLASIAARHPGRFSGFAHHALLPGAGAELRRAVDELGLRGYKLLGPRTELPFEDPQLRDVWEFCAERRLPVLIHFGFLGRGGGVVSPPRMSPLSLFEVARAIPASQLIILYFGTTTWHIVPALACTL